MVIEFEARQDPQKPVPTGYMVWSGRVQLGSFIAGEGQGSCSRLVTRRPEALFCTQKGDEQLGASSGVIASSV